MKTSKTKILGAIWFTNRDGTTGVVRVEDPYDGIRYYIGTTYFAPSRPGEDSEAVDSKHIAEWGSTFPTEAGDVLFGIK